MTHGHDHHTHHPSHVVWYHQGRESSWIVVHWNKPGLVRHTSTESQILIILHDFTYNCDLNIQVDIAILDFAKSFGTVPHDLLLGKLQNYSFLDTFVPQGTHSAGRSRNESKHRWWNGPQNFMNICLWYVMHLSYVCWVTHYFMSIMLHIKGRQ